MSTTSKRKKKSKPIKRSRLEDKVAEILGDSWEYEAEKIPYTLHKHYLTDFSKRGIIFEVKGFFRPGDTAKYKAVVDSLPADKEFIFIFQDDKKPVRKGAKLTMGGWAEKVGIRYTTVSTLEVFLHYDL